MAFCPKCGGHLEAKQVTCPHCNYDFPQPPAGPDRWWQIPLIVAGLTAATVWGWWDNPVVAIVCGVCGLLTVVILVFRLWRLITD